MAYERAVSPVVSVALLIGIAVIMATVIGLAMSDLGLGSAEAPKVTLSFEVTNDQVVMTHEGGDPLESDNVVVLDQDGNHRSGPDSDMEAGESEVVVDNVGDVDRITVVWRDPGSDTASVLANFKL